VDEVGHDGRQPLQRHYLMHRHDAGVAQLRRRPGLALEALQLLVLGQQAAVRDLQGHDPVQLGVAGLPDSSEGAQPHPLQELELAQGAHAGRGRGGPGLAHLEAAAAAGAEHLARSVIRELNRILAMRAAEALPLPGPRRLRRGGAVP
jgi:hypothetical protein